MLLEGAEWQASKTANGDMCPRPTAQAIRDLKGDSFSLDEDAEAAAVPGEVVNSPPDDFAAQLGGVMGASGYVSETWLTKRWGSFVFNIFC